MTERNFMVEYDELQVPEGEWPNDDEASDIMLGFAATDDSHSSRSGCAGLVLVVSVIIFSLGLDFGR